ncbi:MAG: hypothetical protein R3B93_12430 [Bacteroidia bacterium]
MVYTHTHQDHVAGLMM